MISKLTSRLVWLILATSMITVSGLTSASMLDLTNQGNGMNIGIGSSQILSVTGINDAIESRNAAFKPKASQVPVLAFIWLFAPCVVGLFGYYSTRKPKPDFYINTNGL